MVTIENKGNGYRMKFSAPGSGMRGWTATAGSLDEMKVALDHYYIGNNHLGYVKGCPICSLTHKEEICVIAGKKSKKAGVSA